MVENVHWIAPACAFGAVFLAVLAIFWPKRPAHTIEIRFNNDEGEAIEGVPAVLAAALERHGRHMR